MNFFEKVFSPKQDNPEEQLPAIPDVQPGLEEFPIAQEIDRGIGQGHDSEIVRGIIDNINKEDKTEAERQRIIDGIIEERDKGKLN